ncbi:MAG: SNF2-related protein, partial [Pedosphaera sp.]|nr:SNF2-related protein [Pedosphaera sp.]
MPEPKHPRKGRVIQRKGDGSPPAMGDTATPLSPLLELRICFDQVNGFAEFIWTVPNSDKAFAVGRVRCTGLDELTWETEQDGHHESAFSPHGREAVRSALDRWFKQFPTSLAGVSACWLRQLPGAAKPHYETEPPFGPGDSPYPWIEANIVEMAEDMRYQFAPLAKFIDEINPGAGADFERFQRRWMRKEQKQMEAAARRQETMAKLAAQRRQRELELEQVRKAEAAARGKPQPPSVKAPTEASPLPPLPVRFEMPALSFQETVLPLPNLDGFFLRERAALWWVSNQSDDLLCLPHCRIERLEYQLRTALRVLGPLRGRALLSDEVGLGKTIEAGIVIKELLTRGMVKRFLVLTVPSLVDQWQEELAEKFSLTTATTNQPDARGDAQQFWGENPGIIASLHTLKQPAHLAIAGQVKWDILIVDEAHYLRNRESQAWQA